MQYDVIVIGSGPGGYVAAIRCAQLGLKTAVIEKYSTFGGTCLNVGCIPSKALLDSSEHYHNAAHHFGSHGINLSNLKVDMKQMIARKDDVIKQNVTGIEFLFKKNKIDSFTGVGSFVDKNTIKVTKNDGKTEQVSGKHVIIATGSKPTALPFLPVDKKRIITSTEALALAEVPNHLIVIGGGVIGLELGSVYARLGSKVSVIEYEKTILPTMDGGLGKELQRVLKKNTRHGILPGPQSNRRNGQREKSDDHRRGSKRAACKMGRRLLHRRCGPHSLYGGTRFGQDRHQVGRTG